MGNAASGNGKNNDELIDHLVTSNSIKTKYVEQAMRLVDRGIFILKEDHEEAYKDQVWKSKKADPGFFHLSAPCIYASVLENLEFRSGLSFLNIGSGTGYLSSIVGYLLGDTGINHGVELYDNVVSYANKNIEAILRRPETSAFGWKQPEFFCGNAFQINTEIFYDRIYCGALVPASNRSFFCNLLKIDGILVMPYGRKLHRVIRKSQTLFITNDISDVTFSNFIVPNVENPITMHCITLPLHQVDSLMEICRTQIRRHIRNTISEGRKIKIRSKIPNKTQESSPQTGPQTFRQFQLERRRNFQRRFARQMVEDEPEINANLNEEQPPLHEHRRRLFRSLNRRAIVQAEGAAEAPMEINARHLFPFIDNDIEGRENRLNERPEPIRMINPPPELLRDILPENLIGRNFQIAIEVDAQDDDEDEENRVQIPHIMNDREFALKYGFRFEEENMNDDEEEDVNSRFHRFLNRRQRQPNRQMGNNLQGLGLNQAERWFHPIDAINNVNELDEEDRMPNHLVGAINRNPHRIIRIDSSDDEEPEDEIDLGNARELDTSSNALTSAEEDANEPNPDTSIVNNEEVVENETNTGIDTTFDECAINLSPVPSSSKLENVDVSVEAPTSSQTSSTSAAVFGKRARVETHSEDSDRSAKRANHSNSGLNVQNSDNLGINLQDGVGHALDNPEDSQNLEEEPDPVPHVDPLWPDYSGETDSESETEDTSNNVENDDSEVQTTLFYPNQENSEQLVTETADEIEIRQQARSMELFHKDIQRFIEDMPLTVNMKNFLLYRY